MGVCMTGQRKRCVCVYVRETEQRREGGKERDMEVYMRDRERRVCERRMEGERKRDCV